MDTLMDKLTPVYLTDVTDMPTNLILKNNENLIKKALNLLKETKNN